MLELYSRGFDVGSAEQMVLVQDGTVMAQWLVPIHPDCHVSSGNPEMVGQTMTDYAGQGFRQIEEWHGEWSREEFDTFLDELYVEKVLRQCASSRQRVAQAVGA